MNYLSVFVKRKDGKTGNIRRLARNFTRGEIFHMVQRSAKPSEAAFINVYEQPGNKLISSWTKVKGWHKLR